MDTNLWIRIGIVKIFFILFFIDILKEVVVRWGFVYFFTCLTIGRGGMGLSCVRGVLGWMLGRIFLSKGLLDIGIGCLGKWWSYYFWRFLKDV